MFVQQTKTASIVGFSLNVWLMVIACILNLTVFSPPLHMPWYLYFVPSFTFSRAFSLLCMTCGYKNCVESLNSTPPEVTNCIIALYVMALVFLVLGLYLYEVVPQTYGVARPWNFLCKRDKRKGKKSMERDTDEIGDLEEQH